MTTRFDYYLTVMVHIDAATVGAAIRDDVQSRTSPEVVHGVSLAIRPGAAR